MVVVKEGDGGSRFHSVFITQSRYLDYKVPCSSETIQLQIWVAYKTLGVHVKEAGDSVLEAREIQSGLESST